MEKKKRFTPFPKKVNPQTGCRVVDLEKLKEMYLEGTHYDWAPFCRHYGFNDRTAGKEKWVGWKNDFDEWKQQWLKLRVKDQDDSLATEVLDVRKAVAVQRIAFVRDWTKRAQYMKKLLDAILMQHGDALQHDIQNTLAIQAGKTQRKFKLDSEELSNMTNAALRLQELEARALMINGGKNTQPVINEDGTADYDKPKQLESPGIQVTTMGNAGLSAAETAKLLGQWFDQSGKKDEDDEPQSAV